MCACVCVYVCACVCVCLRGWIRGLFYSIIFPPMMINMKDVNRDYLIQDFSGHHLGRIQDKHQTVD